VDRRIDEAALVGMGGAVVFVIFGGNSDVDRSIAVAPLPQARPGTHLWIKTVRSVGRHPIRNILPLRASGKFAARGDLLRSTV
jgi:hypothetical protein